MFTHVQLIDVSHELFSSLIWDASDFHSLNLHSQFNWNNLQVYYIDSSEFKSDVKKSALPT